MFEKAKNKCQTLLNVIGLGDSPESLRASNPYSREGGNVYNNIQNKILNSNAVSPQNPYEILSKFESPKIPIPPKETELYRQQIQPQMQQQQQALQPIEPATPGIEQYRKDMNINPELFDAIMRAEIPVDPNEQVGGMNAQEYIRRLVMNLAARESSGGRNLYGDHTVIGYKDEEKKQPIYDYNDPNSFGAYHINKLYRGDVPGQSNPISIEDSMDFDKATAYVIKEIMRNKEKKGQSYDQLIKSWNSKSGYVNNGPKYDVDMPRMATASAFLRGQ